MPKPQSKEKEMYKFNIKNQNNKVDNNLKFHSHFFQRSWMNYHLSASILFKLDLLHY